MGVRRSRKDNGVSREPFAPAKGQNRETSECERTGDKEQRQESESEKSEREQSAGTKFRKKWAERVRHTLGERCGL